MLPGNAKIWQGFALCWTAATLIALGEYADAKLGTVVAFSAPLWITGILRLVEGLLENGGRWGKRD